jgi:hypothetical protein
MAVCFKCSQVSKVLRLSKCVQCFRLVCEKCAIRRYSQKFCCEECARGFFFGLDEEQWIEP